MAEKWVLLYSAKQDAYHVETEADYRAKGPSAGGYRIVGAFDSQEDALSHGFDMRIKKRHADVLR